MPRGVAKVPQVMQMEALECGAACLAMILAYHGRWVPLEQLRVDCGVSRDGVKASKIMDAAELYGLSVRSFVYTTDTLQKKVTYPCIVYWNFNHFVVLDGFRGTHAYLNDPARGEVRVTMDEFESSFTGVALTFERTDAFEEGGTKPDALASVRRRLEGLSRPILFVMAAAALTSVTSIISSSLARVFLDQVLGLGNTEILLPLVTVIVAVALVSCVVGVLDVVGRMRIQGKIAVTSSARFMRHLLHLPVGFFEQRSVGDLQQRQQSNSSIAFQLVGELAPVLINASMLVLYLAIMLNYSVVLTMVGVVCVVLNALAARHISDRRTNISRSMAANSGNLSGATQGGIEMI